MDSRKVLDEPLPQATPPGFALDEVERAPRTPPRTLSSGTQLMNHASLSRLHPLRRPRPALSRRLARSLRLALAGWTGRRPQVTLPAIAGSADRRPETVPCRLRSGGQRYTRFVVLGQRDRRFPISPPGMMAAMLRQLSSDWQHHYGHPLLVDRRASSIRSASPAPCFRPATGPTSATARATRAATATTPTLTATRSVSSCAPCGAMPGVSVSQPGQRCQTAGGHRPEHPDDNRSQSISAVCTPNSKTSPTTAAARGASTPLRPC